MPQWVGAYVTSEDTPLTITAAYGVLANDIDVEGSPLTAILVSGPAFGAIQLESDGSFVYTPSANFAGTDTFTYRASDGSAVSNAATVTIRVTAVNDAPVLADTRPDADCQRGRRPAGRRGRVTGQRFHRRDLRRG